MWPVIRAMKSRYWSGWPEATGRALTRQDVLDINEIMDAEEEAARPPPGAQQP